MSVAIPSGVMAAASVVQHETSSCEGWGAMPVTERWSHTVTSHCETCKSKIFSRDEIFRLEDCVADPEQVQANTQSWEGRRQRAVQRPRWHQFYTILSFKSSRMKGQTCSLKICLTS